MLSFEINSDYNRHSSCTKRAEQQVVNIVTYGLSITHITKAYRQL